jgi:Na+/alanine symporter
MAFPNLIGIVLLSGVVIKETQVYLAGELVHKENNKD